jgi:hypothetical protein
MRDPNWATVAAVLPSTTLLNSEPYTKYVWGVSKVSVVFVADVHTGGALVFTVNVR